MNYYDELLLKIEDLLDRNNVDEVRNIINQELSLPYIPREYEIKFKDIMNELGPKESFIRELSDEDIIKYLYSSKEKQLIAVDKLDKKNLRDYLDICNEYLISDGFKNAKVLLIDSLIRQEINEEITYNDSGLEYCFIPKYVLPIEKSDGFIDGKKYLCEVYLKEPSKLKMALDLLYKEMIICLPVNQESEEGLLLAKDIEKYINNAFEV